MVLAGLKLTGFGIGVVFLFLGLLVVLIKVMSKILQPFTAQEEAKYHTLPSRKVPIRPATDEKQRIMAVITAAIAAHRARQPAVAPGIPPVRQAQPSETVPGQIAGNPHGSRQAAPNPGELFYRDPSVLAGLRHRFRQ